MRGYANFNFPAFDYAAGKLRADGHCVFSPAENDRLKHGPEVENNPTGDESKCPPSLTIRTAMADDTAWICAHADAIALLPGWEKSSGANAEVALSKALGLTVITLGKDFVQQ